MHHRNHKRRLSACLVNFSGAVQFRKERKGWPSFPQYFLVINNLTALTLPLDNGLD